MAIKQINNTSKTRIFLVKLEDRNDNRFVDSGACVDTDIWTPHVDSEDDFIKKTIVVMNLEEPRVLGYVWEHKGTLRSLNRVPRKFDANGPRLPGLSRGDIMLTVAADGTLRGDSRMADEPRTS